MNIEDTRELWPVAKEVAYLYCAGEMPIATPVRKAIEEMLTRKERPHELGLDDYFGLPRRVRERLARLINAAPEEIGIVGPTSAAFSALAHSLPLMPGDEVIIPQGEHPAAVYPWLSAASLRGIVVRFVEADAGVIPTERLLSAIGPKTRVISCSLVGFSSGFRCDAERIGAECRERGIYFVLDGIQAVGAIPTDVKAIGCTAIAGSGYKWLCSLSSIGFLYVDKEILPALEPPTTGWICFMRSEDFGGVTDYDYRLLSDGRKFETGTTPHVELAAMEAGLKLVEDIGVENIRNHIFTLLDRLAEFLKSRGLEIMAPLDPEHRSTILCFRHPRFSELKNYLAERKVIVSVREGAIRVSPGVFCTVEDIDMLVRAVSDFDAGH